MILHFMQWITLSILIWCFLIFAEMFWSARRAKKRIAKWDELGKKAAKGDAKAFLELIYSGPGKSGYK